MIITKTILALSMSFCFASDDVGDAKPNFVPRLNLAISVAPSTHVSSPMTSRSLDEHKKQYSLFYRLLNVSEFITKLREATNHGSLPSTLFRPDPNGESVNRFLKIVEIIRTQGLKSDQKLSEKSDMMQNLLEVFGVIDSTAEVFIPKALEACAKFIKEARDDDDRDRYMTASGYLNGTIENLKNFISYLDIYGSFIRDLMRSQKELFLLLASQEKLSETEIENTDSIFYRVSQCDFAIDRIQRKFKEQLAEAYGLKVLIPQAKIEGEQILEKLLSRSRAKESSPVAESSSATTTSADLSSTPRRRGLSLLGRVKSKRELLDGKESGKDHITREPSSDSVVASSESSGSASPKTPRGRSKAKDKTTQKSE